MVAIGTRTEQYKIQTVEEFEEWLIHQPDLVDKRFEFLDGELIEKGAMKQQEIIIIDFLVRMFMKTIAFQNGDILLPEIDSYIHTKRKRIPDLAYFTKGQIVEGAKGVKLATYWAIELLSDSESLEDIEEKVEDYFSAGAQLVWYISPKRQQIYVFTAPHEVKILKGTDVCSAAPVLSDFSFTVSDLFAVPEL